MAQPQCSQCTVKTLEGVWRRYAHHSILHQPSRLLPTLRSRCQALFCQTPDHEQSSFAWLQPSMDQRRARQHSAGIYCIALLKALALAANDNLDYATQEVITALQDCRQKK